MAKKTEEHHEGKPKRKHLHEMRISVADDGTHVHHEMYKKHKDDHEAEPERIVGTTRTPEEAGQHVEDRLAMNAQPGEEQGGGEPQDPAGGGGEAQPAGGDPGASDGEEM